MTDSFPNPTGPVIDAFAPVRRVALWFGGGVGVLCSVWIMGLHLTGNNAFGPKQLLAELLVPFVALASQWVLRRRLLPVKLGLGRAMAVGGLTVLLAAALCALTIWALGYVVGEATLARHRAEITEIMQTQQQDPKREHAPVTLTAVQRAAIAGITVNDLAVSNFKTVLLLGLVFSLPGGIFFRE